MYNLHFIGANRKASLKGSQLNIKYPSRLLTCCFHLGLFY